MIARLFRALPGPAAIRVAALVVVAAVVLAGLVLFYDWLGTVIQNPTVGL